MKNILLKYIFAILFLISISIPCQAQVGLFVRPNSSSLTSPVSGQTWLFNSSNNTVSVYNGSTFALTSQAKGNFSAVSNPTTSNDNTQGYSSGSVWYNTGNSNLYVCTSAVTNAAVWVLTNNLGSNSIPLTQLQAGGAVTGQSLIYNGTHWSPATPNISLGNILQSAALIGQIPIWNGTAWVPGTAPGGSYLIPLTQIAQSGATDGQAVIWNDMDGVWESTTIPFKPAPDLSSVNSILYFNNGTGQPTWTPNESNNVGSLLYVGLTGHPQWSNATSLTAWSMPYLTNSDGSIHWIPGLIGNTSDATAPWTGATIDFNPPQGSLIVVDPDGSSGSNVRIPSIFENNVGLVLVFKNIGTVSDVTVTLVGSGDTFNTPTSGVTTQVLTPGQCLMMMAQPNNGAVNTVWIVISLM